MFSLTRSLKVVYLMALGTVVLLLSQPKPVHAQRCPIAPMLNTVDRQMQPSMQQCRMMLMMAGGTGGMMGMMGGMMGMRGGMMGMGGGMMGMGGMGMGGMGMMGMGGMGMGGMGMGGMMGFAGKGMGGFNGKKAL